MEPTQTTLRASDIRCDGCAAAARAAVRNVPGVQQASVNLPEQTATVTHAPQTRRADLAAALTRAGFPAE